MPLRRDHVLERDRDAVAGRLVDERQVGVELLVARVDRGAVGVPELAARPRRVEQARASSAESRSVSIRRSPALAPASPRAPGGLRPLGKRRREPCRVCTGSETNACIAAQAGGVRK